MKTVGLTKKIMEQRAAEKEKADKAKAAAKIKSEKDAAGAAKE